MEVPTPKSKKEKRKKKKCNVGEMDSAERVPTSLWSSTSELIIEEVPTPKSKKKKKKIRTWHLLRLLVDQ